VAYSKTTVDQTQEIEKLVADVLEQLDQVRYALKTLETRLKEQSSRTDDDSAAG
jgi:hypothetical protein